MKVKTTIEKLKVRRDAADEAAALAQRRLNEALIEAAQFHVDDLVVWRSGVYKIVSTKVSYDRVQYEGVKLLKSGNDWGVMAHHLWGVIEPLESKP